MRWTVIQDEGKRQDEMCAVWEGHWGYSVRPGKVGRRLYPGWVESGGRFGQPE